MSNLEIKEVFWIDKSVFNEENKIYKEIMKETYGLEVHQFDNTEAGIKAIKEAEYYVPIYIITSGSIILIFMIFLKMQLPILKICLSK